MKNLKIIFISLFCCSMFIANCLKSNVLLSKDYKDLVDVTKVNPNIKIDIRYATSNNFTKQVLYSCAKCYLREKVAAKLDKIQKILERKGLCLKVWDAYRPYSAQKKMWEVFPNADYVAPPERGSKHNRAACVDVTLVDLKSGKELVMPTEFDDFSEKAAVNCFKGLTVEQIQNRDYLQNVMTQNGFTPNESEWWHFNDSEWVVYDLLDVDFEDL